MGADRVSGRVVGFRQWELTDAHLLASTGVSAVWGTGTHRARCAKAADEADHSPPGAECECGLYALREPTWGLVDGPPPWGAPNLTGVVHGAVVAWGRVFVHANGFRAEFARIAALGFNPGWPADERNFVRDLADAYGVAALPFGEVRLHAAMLGDELAGEWYDRQRRELERSLAGRQGFPPGEQPYPPVTGLDVAALRRAWQASHTAASSPRWSPAAFQFRPEPAPRGRNWRSRLGF